MCNGEHNQKHVDQFQLWKEIKQAKQINVKNRFQLMHYQITINYEMENILYVDTMIALELKTNSSPVEIKTANNCSPSTEYLLH